MEQKDYILREIEKIGAMLAGMIGKMIVAKEKGGMDDEDYTELAEEFKEKSLLDLELILSCPEDEIEILLAKDLGFGLQNIELLADLVAGLSRFQESAPGSLKKRAVLLYELVNRKSKTYSMERAEKINQLSEE